MEYEDEDGGMEIDKGTEMDKGAEMNKGAEMDMDEVRACYILSQCESIGSRTLSRMREHYGSYNEAFRAGIPDMRAAGLIKEKQADAMGKVWMHMDEYKRRYEALIRNGVRVIIRGSRDYPARLDLIEAAPELLYTRGGMPEDGIPSAAIIGARMCTGYGISAAKFFASELARAGIQIVSGLAYGIDAAASEGAIEAGGRSFAVLGTGIDICYPKENFMLYSSMAGINSESSGGVISEFPPGSEAMPQHFVMRNRLIAGLADVVLVIEAKEKSGTSITVGYALDQGKDIFALPGRINDPFGRGCNRLIRDGAIPLLGPEDVLSYFGMEGDQETSPVMKKELSGLGITEKKVYGSLTEDARHVADIADITGLGLRAVLSALYTLEFKGLAVSTASAFYKRA